MADECEEVGCAVGLTRAKVALMEDQHNRVMKILFDDNGDKGLVTMVRDFIRDHQQERVIRAEYEAARDRKESRRVYFMTVAMVILTIAMLAVALLEANRQMKQNLLQPPAIFHSSTEPQSAQMRNRTFAY